MTRNVEIKQYPHCDPSIMHAPGECEVCDAYPAWQALRKGWRINFTGHHDPDLAPCPSEIFRSFEDVNIWHGNQADENQGQFASSADSDEYDRRRSWESALSGFHTFYREDREITRLNKEIEEKRTQVRSILVRRKV